MKKVDLNKVFEMLINEEHDEATNLLREWFIEKTKAVHEELMAEEDDELSSDIEDDQEAIKAEEIYGEAAEDEIEAGEEVLDSDEETEEDAEDDLGDTIEDLEAAMARLKAEYNKIVGSEDEEIEEEIGNRVDDEDRDELEDSYDAEIPATGDEVIIKGKKGVVGEQTDEDIYGGPSEFVVTFEDGTSGVFSVDEITGVSVDETNDHMDMGSDDIEGDEDFSDLEESWDLETVRDKLQNVEGALVGDEGKIKVNTQSGFLSKKPSERLAGKPVEIKSTEHKGYEREKAPAVKATNMKKNGHTRSTDGRTTISKEGDKSALLNSKAGFGSDSPNGPISGAQAKGK